MKEYTVKVKYVDYDYCTVTALNKTEAMMKAKDMYEGFILEKEGACLKK